MNASLNKRVPISREILFLIRHYSKKYINTLKIKLKQIGKFILDQ